MQGDSLTEQQKTGNALATMARDGARAVKKGERQITVEPIKVSVSNMKAQER